MSTIIGEDRYYTVGEVALAAGKSTQTIKRWTAAGKIPEASRLKHNGWRIYSEEQRDEIVRFAKQIVSVSANTEKPSGKI